MPHTPVSPTTEAADVAGLPLLDDLEPPPGAHALVIGHHTLEILCDLIRRGCAGAAELRPDESGIFWPDVADVVVLADPASLAEAAVSVAIARRALTRGGRIAIRDADGRHRRELAALLRAQGFVSVTTRKTRTGAVVRGEHSVSAAGA